MPKDSKACKECGKRHAVYFYGSDYWCGKGCKKKYDEKKQKEKESKLAGSQNDIRVS